MSTFNPSLDFSIFDVDQIEFDITPNAFVELEMHEAMDRAEAAAQESSVNILSNIVVRESDTSSPKLSGRKKKTCSTSSSNKGSKLMKLLKADASRKEDTPRKRSQKQNLASGSSGKAIYENISPVSNIQPSTSFNVAEAGPKQAIVDTQQPSTSFAEAQAGPVTTIVDMSRKPSTSFKIVESQQQQLSQMVWLNDFHDVQHRETMASVFRLWSSLRRDMAKYKSEMETINKSVAEINKKNDEDEEIIHAARSRIATRNEELGMLEMNLQIHRNQFDGCKVQLQHFKQFGK